MEQGKRFLKVFNRYCSRGGNAEKSRHHKCLLHYRASSFVLRRISDCKPLVPREEGEGGSNHLYTTLRRAHTRMYTYRRENSRSKSERKNTVFPYIIIGVHTARESIRLEKQSRQIFRKSLILPVQCIVAVYEISRRAVF